MKSLWPLLLLITSRPTSVQSHDFVMAVHGSGATTLSHCFWFLLQQLTERAKWPIRLSYRSVGTGIGQAEFMGLSDDSDSNNTVVFAPSNDFGAGDKPMSSADFGLLEQEGIAMAHFPFVLSSVGIYHSASLSEVAPLNLTACLVAKIFRRIIDDWSDSEILDLNPELDGQFSSSFPITVVRPEHGTDSTELLTEYLFQTCPTSWPEDFVGRNITWHDDTVGCNDSKAAMTKCIHDTAGAIGFMDDLVAATRASDASSVGVKEVALRNFNERFVTLSEAMEQNGVAEAAASSSSLIPTSVFEDFAQVSLLDQPGDYTWPIVRMSYVYIRKDLSHVHSPEEQTLLKVLLRTLYEPVYIDQCVSNFGFSKVPDSLRQQALQGIEELELTSDEVEEWVLESSTNVLTNVGQGDFTISERRQNWAEMVRSDTASEAEMLSNQIVALEARVTTLHQQLLDMEELMQQQGVPRDAGQDQLTRDELLNEFDEYTKSDEQRVTTALVLASLSIVFCVVTMGVIVGRSSKGKKVDGRGAAETAVV